MTLEECETKKKQQQNTTLSVQSTLKGPRAANIHFGRKRSVQMQTACQGSATTSEDTTLKQGTKAKAHTVIPLGRCCRQHRPWEARRRPLTHGSYRCTTADAAPHYPSQATRKQFGATSLSKEPA